MGVVVMSLAIRQNNGTYCLNDIRIPKMRSLTIRCFCDKPHIEYEDINNKKHTSKIYKSKYGKYVVIQKHRYYLLFGGNLL